MTSPKRKRASAKRARALRREPAKPAKPPIVVRRSSIDQRGGFATRQIERGERIIEYVGEHITWKEADRRYPDDFDQPTHTVLFQLTSRTVIDGGVGGNAARFINHSCKPNCEAIDDKGRIYIDATRRIKKGDELTYDYALTRDKALGAAEDKLYPCRCRSKGCRKTILEPARKRPRRKKKKPLRG